MKKFLITAALATTTLAALPAQAQTDGTSWTGPYAGARIGYSWQPNDNDERISFDNNLDGRFDDIVRSGNATTGPDAFSPGYCGGLASNVTPGGGCSDDKDAVTYYGMVGFDYQLGNIVVGVVGEYGNANVTDKVSAFSTTPANYTMTRSLRGTGSVRGRAGYAYNDTLLYGTGGLAYGRVRNRFGTSNNGNSFTNANGSDARQVVTRDHVWGYTFGGGIDQRVAPNFSIGLLYLYTSLKDNDYRVNVGRGTQLATNPFVLANANGTTFRRSHSEFNRHDITVTAAFRF